MAVTRRALILVICAACGPSKPAVTVPAPPGIITDVRAAPEPGLVPPQPGMRLPKNFVPTKYAVRLAINPKVADFTGVMQIAGTVSERSSGIWLHAEELVIESAAVDGAPMEVTAGTTGDTILLRTATPLEPGPVTISIAYRGAYDLVNTVGAFKQTVAGESYVYTQLEAMYARRVFPCVDEPDTKVPWQLTLDVPVTLEAVANTPVADELQMSGIRRVTFAPTKPLPSYLIAFGVGPFDIVPAGATKRGVPVRVVTLKGRAREAAYAVETSAKIVDAAEEWFGTPYPFEKLDMLTIPITIGFGAMENAGLITYTESVMLIDPAQGSLDKKYDWVQTAAHEIAHQWYGDLVTPVWWDDIWLNESFATWAQEKVVSAFDKSWNVAGEPERIRAGALGQDAIVSARKIRQPVEQNDDITLAFDYIVYSKGSAVLSMLEAYVGRDAFQQGVRAYLAEHAFGNATAQDFVGAISQVTGKDLTVAFASFLDQSGAPQLTTTLDCTSSKAKLAIAQRRYVAPGSPPPAQTTPWVIPVCIAYDQDGQRATTCTVIDTAEAVVELPAKACPAWVMPNADGAGYFRVAYTEQAAAALRDQAWPKLTVAERRAVAFDLNAGALDGTLAFGTALSLVPKLLSKPDRYTLPLATQPTAFAAFVPPSLQPTYERYLRTTYGKAAAAVGLLPKAGDTYDDEEMRNKLVGVVAWGGREPKLVAQATKLAKKWRELPQAMRGLILQIAVDHDPALFAKVLAEVPTEPDRALREEMMNAVVRVRDPVRAKQALGLVLDPTLDIRESFDLGQSMSTPETQEVAHAFYREHVAEILQRAPTTTTATPFATLGLIWTRPCRAEHRATAEAEIKATFATLPGATPVIAQVLEGMDQCISQRARLGPVVAQWLKKL